MSRMQEQINAFKRNTNGRPLFDNSKYMPDIMNPNKSRKKLFDLHHDSEIARLQALDSILQAETAQLNAEDPRNVINGYYQQFMPHLNARQSTERNRSVNRDEVSNLMQPQTMRYDRNRNENIDTLERFKRDYELKKSANDNSFNLDQGYHLQNGKNHTQIYENRNDLSGIRGNNDRTSKSIQTEDDQPNFLNSSPMKNNKTNGDQTRPNLIAEAIRESRDFLPSNRQVSKSVELRNSALNALNNLNTSMNQQNSNYNSNTVSPRVDKIYNSNPDVQHMQRYNSQAEFRPSDESSPPIEKGGSKLLDQGYKKTPFLMDNKKVVTYNIIANKPIQRDLPNKTRLPYKYAWEVNKDLPAEIGETLNKLQTLETQPVMRDSSRNPDGNTASLDRLKNYDPRKNGNVFTLALRNEINNQYSAKGDIYDPNLLYAK